MDQAEELYKRVNLYTLNHSKWLELLQSMGNDPRGAYNTAELDQRLFLLNDQLKTVQGQCVAIKAEIRDLLKSIPTQVQFDMATERLSSLRHQRDEISSDLKGILTKIQQRDLLEAMDESLTNQLEVLHKEYEAEELTVAKKQEQVTTPYKDLGERLNSLKALID